MTHLRLPQSLYSRSFQLRDSRRYAERKWLKHARRRSRWYATAPSSSTTELCQRFVLFLNRSFRVVMATNHETQTSFMQPGERHDKLTCRHRNWSMTTRKHDIVRASRSWPASTGCSAPRSCTKPRRHVARRRVSPTSDSAMTRAPSRGCRTSTCMQRKNRRHAVTVLSLQTRESFSGTRK